MRNGVLFLLTALLMVVPVVSAQNVSVSGASQSYRLGPGDEITTKVLGEDQFNFVATVAENGMIDIPYSDKPIVAECRTQSELRSAIKAALSKQLKDPQISINTKSNSRPPAIVSGEVHVPAPYVLLRKVSLLELISQSGGPTEDAGGMVQVFRTQPPLCSEKTDEANWAATDKSDAPSRLYSLSSLRLGDESSNPTIYPGDVVLLLKAKPVYVTGQVISPQGVYIKEGGLTLTEAIAKVSGLREDAQPKDVNIYRLKANSKDRDQIKADLRLIKSGQQKDIPLEPYDIIEVGKAKDSLAITIAKIAVGMGKSAVTSGFNTAGSRIMY